MKNITVCGVVHNEERRLTTLFPFLKRTFDKLVFVVQESTDRTLELANEYCYKVIKHRRMYHSEPSRGELIRNIDTEWMLYLDADEVPTEGFLRALPRLINCNFDAYNLNFDFRLDGKFLEQKHVLRLHRTKMAFSLPLYHSPWQSYSTNISQIDYVAINHHKLCREFELDNDIAKTKDLNYHPPYVFYHRQDVAEKNLELLTTEPEEYGFWTTRNQDDFEFNEDLAEYLVEETAGKTVYDFGCGNGGYVQRLRPVTSACDGFDGNPLTPILSKGHCFTLNAAIPIDLGFKRDFVTCVDVVEHIPEKYLPTFVENMVKHGNKIILRSKKDIDNFLCCHDFRLTKEAHGCRMYERVKNDTCLV